MDQEYTAQQRAARVAAMLTQRCMLDLGGLTAMEIGELVCLSDRGARRMMHNLELMDWPFFYCENGRWCVILRCESGHTL